MIRIRDKIGLNVSFDNKDPDPYKVYIISSKSLIPNSAVVYILVHFV